MKANISSSNTNAAPSVTPEMLKDGTVLCSLIVRFVHNSSKENLFAVLSCLRDSNVFVPCKVNMNGADFEPVRENPVMFPAKHSISVEPQLYRASDGKTYMPFYSRRENARQSELKGASLVNLPYEKLVDMLNANSECSRFVIDPKLYNVIMDEELIKISMQLPSRLGSD